MINTHNGSKYTFTLANLPTLTRGNAELLEKNANAAIEYLADHIRWKGVLDFVMYWDKENILGDYWIDDGPGFAAYGDASTGELAALAEATTGNDTNEGDFEAGMWVGPNNKSISNYGEDIYIDPDPNPLHDDISSNDVLSIFLHETLHSMGMWSNLQHQKNDPSIKPTAFDLLTKKIGNQWFFIGEKTQEIHGGPLPLALTGSRDHYSDSLDFDIDLMREFGLNEKWQISDIDLAILSDLGHNVVKWSSKSKPQITESKPQITVIKHDHYDEIIGTTNNDKLKARGRKEYDIFGKQGDDFIVGGPNYDRLDGGPGNDKLKGKKGADTYILSPGKDKFLGFKISEGDTIEIDSSIEYEVIPFKRHSKISHDDGLVLVKNISADEIIDSILIT